MKERRGRGERREREKKRAGAGRRGEGEGASRLRLNNSHQQLNNELSRACKIKLVKMKETMLIRITLFSFDF